MLYNDFRLKLQTGFFLLNQAGGKIILEHTPTGTKTSGTNRTLARQRAFELPKVI